MKTRTGQTLPADFRDLFGKSILVHNIPGMTSDHIPLRNNPAPCKIVGAPLRQDGSWNGRVLISFDEVKKHHESFSFNCAWKASESNYVVLASGHPSDMLVLWISPSCFELAAEKE